jgi:hypothetical protein
MSMNCDEIFVVSYYLELKVKESMPDYLTW